jgi:hypothetical protein
MPAQRREGRVVFAPRQAGTGGFGVIAIVLQVRTIAILPPIVGDADRHRRRERWPVP